MKNNPGIAILLGILFLLFQLLGCGDDTPSQATSSTEDIPLSTNVNRDAITALSAIGDCSESHLIGTWKISSGNTIVDQIKISEDCYFETFTCGQVGYLNSEAREVIGFVEVVLTDYISYPLSSSCPPLIPLRCAYDDIGLGRLTLKCSASL